MEHKGNLEMHLKLVSATMGAIQGESQSKLHSGEIEVTSFSWGASSPSIRSASGTQTKGGRPTVSEITVEKHVDKASVFLFKSLLENSTMTTAKISCSKPTGTGVPEDFLIITLTGAYITSLSSAVTKEGTEIGKETLTLNFQKVEIDYGAQLESGLLAKAASYQYDLTR